MYSVLIIEDNERLRQMLMDTLKSGSVEVDGVKTAEEGLDRVKEQGYDFILLDLRLPGMQGMDALQKIREIDSKAIVIIMTAYGTIDVAVEAMRLGAYDFLTKPFDTDHLLLMFKRAWKERKVEEENLLLKEVLKDKFGFDGILGKSQRIREVMTLAKKVATTDSTVLITGESGTGKELFARAIHQMSKRRNYPFVSINCAAIPRELLENELFGSEKGAYTGSVARKAGKFEVADKGTILLDEVGDLNLHLQAKILRVLERKEFERLGGTKVIKVDVRIITATNKNLLEEIQNSRFREDLYYRLAVFPIPLPSLRERKEDIPLLAEHFVIKYCSELKKSRKTTSSDTMEKLMQYNWPGNVRELENTIERAIILCNGPTIEPHHIWTTLRQEQKSPDTLREASLHGAKLAESELIRRALIATSGNKSKAARNLKVSYRVLLKKIKDYDIRIP
ncbi:hypothetical protein AMJ40_01195 [candidate division TA06 bacterium DG_26]|uniref:Sigma-54-dependent Fis family transcriptional regulator n=1 Tax=candidate division TA06 bacterium DG_26 TaxID=1703771 RepID=A0A0S7WLE5_UNCT6|nr:MAG: hypothetical protein AMJ40_01195 [candidate division TA06 bacterium DG_26]